jgi:hypothetical protein
MNYTDPPEEDTTEEETPEVETNPFKDLPVDPTADKIVEPEEADDGEETDEDE